ncbi:hypothetical protein D3C79_939130 [compost metagenome]
MSNFQKPSDRPNFDCAQGNAVCCSQSSICGASSYKRNNCLASNGTKTNSSAVKINVNRVNTATTPQVLDRPAFSSRSTSGSNR